MGLGTRAVAASAVAALASLGLVACSGDSEGEQVVAAPSALADAADGIRSGRIEAGYGGISSTIVFDGDDSFTTTLWPSPDSMAGDSGSDTKSDTGGDPQDLTYLVVGGQHYMSVGDRYMEMPKDSTSSAMFDDAAEADRWLDGVRSVVEETSVSRPGVRTEDDGVPVIRYRASETGQAATSLLERMSGADAGTSSTWSDLPDDTAGMPPGMSESFARMDRIMKYREDHQKVEVVGDVGEDGSLRRVEISMSSDTSEFPDCEMFATPMDDFHVTVSHINEPQDIRAPSPDRVDPYDVERATESLGMPAGLLGEDDSSSVGEDESSSVGAGDGQLDVQPDEAAGTLSTATGERTVSEVLDYLRRWADAHGIDWRSMSLPDDQQMVTYFDQFYAADVVERGPELTTALGRYPRGYLVEVVNELSPDANAATLDDATLIAAYEAARGDGASPSTSWGAGLGSDDSMTTTTYGDSSTDSGELGPDSSIPDMNDSMDEVFKGCPA